DKQISILLNEFGDINLESQFIERGDITTVELSNGCMCCVAKSDVPRSIRYILDNSPQTEYILIEASGLSEPGPIMSNLTNSDISDRVEVEALVCIVDPTSYIKDSKDHQVVDQQIMDSDIIVLSKLAGV